MQFLHIPLRFCGCASDCAWCTCDLMSELHDNAAIIMQSASVTKKGIPICSSMLVWCLKEVPQSLLELCSNFLWCFSGRLENVTWLWLLKGAEVTQNSDLASQGCLPSYHLSIHMSTFNSGHWISWLCDCVPFCVPCFVLNLSDRPAPRFCALLYYFHKLRSHYWCKSFRKPSRNMMM